MERAIPATPSIRAFIEARHPDLMLLTPLIDLASSQIDYLRAAREFGVPTALCVWSWDHLSSKALIRECPERVFVWNETQKREAVEMHRVPAERVVITGAQCFDHWFDRTPSRTRDEFCARIGLDARPIGEAEAPRFAEVICAAFGMPPFMNQWVQSLASRTGWTAFGAFDDDAMVAGGMRWQGDEGAWLGMAGTLPEARGRGAQGAILRARSAGASGLVITETWVPPPGGHNTSLANMHRAGFVTIAERANYQKASMT